MLRGTVSPVHNVPTYEFRCSNGHDVERFYKTISAAPAEIECPECGAVANRQLSGGAGLLFKGSGFYLTDYGKNAHRKSTGPGPGKSDAGSSGSDAKPDAGSRPATSGESKPASEPKAKPPATPKPKSE